MWYNKGEAPGHPERSEGSYPLNNEILRLRSG